MVELGIIFDLRNPHRWRRKPSELYGSTLELCQEAERLGVKSIWLSEHHQFDDDYLPQPLVFAASVAARTSRVRIGTAVTLAPMRSMPLLAEEAAIVDLVSDGRLELGIGAGYMRHEFALFGSSYDERRATTVRYATGLRELWASGQVTPSPVQERLPFWLGFQGPVGARRTGRLGEGLLSIRKELLLQH
jgi:alkanesulfonate monooxygenase SsuD/methylene tetrahydromethanopterin reductase-like flavin-dependent oxidoreductase (luciferase family)